MKYAENKEIFMNELQCPHCGKAFIVDEGDYANIVQQVRNDEFQKELARREKEMAQRNETNLNIAKMEQERRRCGMDRYQLQKMISEHPEAKISSRHAACWQANIRETHKINEKDFRHILHRSVHDDFMGTGL